MPDLRNIPFRHRLKLLRAEILALESMGPDEADAYAEALDMAEAALCEGEGPMGPFRKCATPPLDMSEAQIAELVRKLDRPRDQVIAMLDDAMRGDWFRNERYQAIRRIETMAGGVRLFHLSIKRIDQRPITSWRDCQAIKNELVGPDYEAVEIYPAEERLVDTANQYHLWGVFDPEFRVPFGFNERLVDRTGSDLPFTGAVQQPMQETVR